MAVRAPIWADASASMMLDGPHFVPQKVVRLPSIPRWRNNSAILVTTVVLRGWVAISGVKDDATLGYNDLDPSRYSTVSGVIPASGFVVATNWASHPRDKGGTERDLRSWGAIFKGGALPHFGSAPVS